MANRMVIAAYRPKPGQKLQLDVLLNHHISVLRAQGLVTDRPATHLRSRIDGTVIEIYEWAADDASELADHNSAVRAIRRRLERIAQPIALAELEESANPAPEFEVIEGINR